MKQQHFDIKLQPENESSYFQARSDQISQVHSIMRDVNSVSKTISVETQKQGETISVVKKNTLETLETVKNANEELEKAILRGKKRKGLCSGLYFKSVLFISFIVFILFIICFIF